ncbi:unnamed protein product [Echinostoma caproni]|uniref:Uncharacterized protein n=1 Tax=Echinostoma caproni TaxID=27848 RepID=A0A3P8I0N9_9TREM|nr:unnamed protein product [Echinostoma caproni]
MRDTYLSFSVIHFAFQEPIRETEDHIDSIWGSSSTSQNTRNFTWSSRIKLDDEVENAWMMKVFATTNETDKNETVVSNILYDKSEICNVGDETKNLLHAADQSISPSSWPHHMHLSPQDGCHICQIPVESFTLAPENAPSNVTPYFPTQVSVASAPQPSFTKPSTNFSDRRHTGGKTISSIPVQSTKRVDSSDAVEDHAVQSSHVSLRPSELSAVSTAKESALLPIIQTEPVSTILASCKTADEVPSFQPPSSGIGECTQIQASTTAPIQSFVQNVATELSTAPSIERSHVSLRPSEPQTVTSGHADTSEQPAPPQCGIVAVTESKRLQPLFRCSSCGHSFLTIPTAGATESIRSAVESEVEKDFSVQSSQVSLRPVNLFSVASAITDSTARMRNIQALPYQTGLLHLDTVEGSTAFQVFPTQVVIISAMEYR